LLHHRLLSLTQVVVGPLKSSVELGLVGRQRDMLAELPQELAFTTDKTLRLNASGYENAEDLTFDLQRRHHQRTQTTLRESPWEWKIHLPYVGFVDESPGNAARQTILIDIDACTLGHCQFERQRTALDSDTGNGERVIGAVVKA